MEKIPENGWTELNLSIYVAGEENRHVELHERIPSWSMVQYKCHENYHNFGAAENMCFENKWRREVPDCELFCQLNQAVPENEMSEVICSRNAIEIPCTERIRIGTNLIAMNERNEPVKKVCSNLAEWDLLSNLIWKFRIGVFIYSYLFYSLLSACFLKCWSV